MRTDEEMLAALEGFALQAARLVMQAFETGCEISTKADDSPVTWADREAEKLILQGLTRFCADIPVVAEEASSAGIEPEDPGREFLLVDPLDGTREFVERRGDFTINIAVIRDSVPAIGIVVAPTRHVMYSGRPGLAERVRLSEGLDPVDRRPMRVRVCGPVPAIVASRSHRSPETDRYIASFPQAELVSVGSSLKFCMLASGEADLYPRLSRTMQWDTAAGDAVLRGAGGMTETLDGIPLVYGPRTGPESERYANPHFISRGAGLKLPEMQPA